MKLNYTTTLFSYLLTIYCTLFSSQLLAVTVGENGQVLVHNWADYFAEDTVSKFENETGIDVIETYFDTNEILLVHLKQGRQFDVIFPSSYVVPTIIDAVGLEELDRSKLTHYSEMDSSIMKNLEYYDPANKHIIPFMWGTTGILYNPKIIKSVMGEDFEINSWGLMFDPAVTSQLAKCGISILAEATEAFPPLFAFHNLDPNPTESSAEMRRMFRKTAMVRPFISTFTSDADVFMNQMIEERACVAMAWSGESMAAIDAAASLDEPVELAYLIPKEGAAMWMDVMAIPKNAPNKSNAHKFIDFIMRPDITADISNYTFYANANTETTAQNLLLPEILSNPGIYPSKEVMTNLFTNKDLGEDMYCMMDKEFFKFRSSGNSSFGYTPESCKKSVDQQADQ